MLTPSALQVRPTVFLGGGVFSSTLAFQSGTFLDRSSSLFPSLKDYQYLGVVKTCTGTLVHSLRLRRLRKGAVPKVLLAFVGAVEVEAAACNQRFNNDMVQDCDNDDNGWIGSYGSSFTVALNVPMQEEGTLYHPSNATGTLQDLDERSALNETDTREALRRQRISKANKGKLPWNKGRQHSQETRKRIRERTIEAMKSPEIRQRLRARVEATTLSPEVRSKIKTSLVKLWSEKKRVQNIQETCVVQWKEAIAEAARQGYDGDVVHRWDSYGTIMDQLRVLWRTQSRRKGRMDTNKSLAHRNKISEAIKSKWADPHYRECVQKGVNAYWVSLGSQISESKEITKSNVLGGVSYKNMRHVRASFEDLLTLREDSSMPHTKPAKDLPTFKDPLSQKKLDKLLQLRAKRLGTEERKRKELTERARILIANAKVAERALEVAAVKDKKALGPLLETRRLLAEAARSFKTVGLMDSSSATLDLEEKERKQGHLC